MRRVLLGEQFLGVGQEADQITPRRDQFRFGNAIASGAIGRKGGDLVIAQGVSTPIIDGANRDDKGIVGRRVEGGRTIVPGGNHDDNAVEPEDFTSRSQRAGVVRLPGAAIEGKVDHANLIGFLVIENPLQPSHDIRFHRHPRFIGHFDVDQIDAGRNADIIAIRLHAIAGNNPGQVGAMTILVNVARRGAIKAFVGNDTSRCLGVNGCQIRTLVDAAIDQRDGDIFPLQVGRPVPDLVSVDGTHIGVL